MAAVANALIGIAGVVDLKEGFDFDQLQEAVALQRVSREHRIIIL